MLICFRHLSDTHSEFSPEEIDVWDAYDNFIGLPKLHNRCLTFPSQVSSIFTGEPCNNCCHWSLHHCRSCPSRRSHPLPKDTRSPTLVGSSFNGGATPSPRTNLFSGVSPPYTGTGVPISDCRRPLSYRPASKCSAKKGRSNRMSGRGRDQHYKLRGCITNRCHKETLTDEKRWRELVDDKYVYAAVGFHPKHARHFSLDKNQVIWRSLQHPKVCALGEVGLDYSGGSWKIQVCPTARFATSDAGCGTEKAGDTPLQRCRGRLPADRHRNSPSAVENSSSLLQEQLEERHKLVQEFPQSVYRLNTTDHLERARNGRSG